MMGLITRLDNVFTSPLVTWLQARVAFKGKGRTGTSGLIWTAKGSDDGKVNLTL